MKKERLLSELAKNQPQMEGMLSVNDFKHKLRMMKKNEPVK